MFAQGDTVAEAAEKLGLDGATVQATLDAYNAMAEAGEDTEFGKKAENLLPITQAPFYVLTMSVTSHGSFQDLVDRSTPDKFGTPEFACPRSGG